MVFIEGSPSDPNVLFGGPMNAESLANWVTDPAAKQHYVDAFSRSDFDAMLAYYKENYPSGSSTSAAPPALCES